MVARAKKSRPRVEPVSGAFSEPSALSLKVAKNRDASICPNLNSCAVRVDGKSVRDGVIALNETAYGNVGAKTDEVH